MVTFKTAVILAGGKSSRMGFDKQELTIKSMPMVCYIAKQLEKIFDDIIIITNRPELYSPSKYKIFSDTYKEKGPMAGIHRGLTLASSSYVYITAGDMPIIDPVYIQAMKKRLLDAKKTDLPPVKACVSIVQGYMEPFNAFYHKSLSSDMEMSIQKDHLKISRFIRERSYISFSEEEISSFPRGLAMFTNLNTPMKVDAFQDRVNHI